jgi:hypothetical protein
MRFNPKNDEDGDSYAQKVSQRLPIFHENIWEPCMGGDSFEDIF